MEPEESPTRNRIYTSWCKFESRSPILLRLLSLKKSGGLTNLLLRSGHSLSGTVSAVDVSGVTLSLGGESTEVEMSEVAAVRWREA